MDIYSNILLWATYAVSLYFAIFFLLIFLDGSLENKKRRANIPNYPKVSVLIPAHNEEETIAETIKSVLQLDYPKEKLEVIVIDDGSMDSTKTIAENYADSNTQVKLISHKNIGKAASLNGALKHAKGEFFACLDADSFVDGAALKHMLSFYYSENNGNLAVITPALKVKSPGNLLQKVQWIEYLVMILVSRLSSRIDSMYVAPGPFSLYKTSIIKKLGGFDEQNLTEDQEIAYRVQAAHYTIKQCPEAFVNTTVPSTIKTFSQQRRRWYKGSLSCVVKYRKLILNRAYGDFGIMQMLKNTLGFFIAVAGISFAGYFIAWPLFTKVWNLSLVGFDIMPYLRNLNFEINLLSFNFPRLFILAVLFTVSFVFFYYSHNNAKEKINKAELIPIVPYFFFYYLVKGSILLYSLAEYSLGRKQRW